jgi:hypothetical protein
MSGSGVIAICPLRVDSRPPPKSNKIIGAKSLRSYLSCVKKNAKFGHLLPTPVETSFHRQQGESNNQFYERYLEGRFGKLEEELQKELAELLGE